MKNPVNDYVCANIRKFRLTKGLRVQDMAKRSGIPLGSYSCLETGRYRLSLENLFRIIHVLDVKITEVWPVGRPISRPVEQIDEEFIEETVQLARQRQPRQVSLDDILEIVCREFDVTREELQSPSRKRHLAAARTVAAVLVKEQRHLTLVELSHAVCRDVSSLAHCMRRLDFRLTYDRELRRRISSARLRLRDRNRRFAQRRKGHKAGSGRRTSKHS